MTDKTVEVDEVDEVDETKEVVEVDEETSAAPKVVQFLLPPATMAQIAWLLPAVAMWAEAEGSDEPVSPLDVVVLAVADLYGRVHSQAHELAAAKIAAAVKH